MRAVLVIFVVILSPSRHMPECSFSLHRFLTRFQFITHYPITLCCSLGKKDEVVSAFAMSVYRGNGGATPLILNLGARWSFTPRYLYPLTEKERPVPVKYEARWAPETVWRFWRKTHFPCRDSNS